VSESAECPAYAEALVSKMRRVRKAARALFYEGLHDKDLYDGALILLQHALELAAKPLLCGCCLATREELKTKVGHSAIAAARLAWDRIWQILAARVRDPKGREELERYREEIMKWYDELRKRAEEIAGAATSAVNTGAADLNALYALQSYIDGYIEGLEQRCSQLLAELLIARLVAPLVPGELRPGLELVSALMRLVLRLIFFTGLLDVIALYHLPFERTYSALKYKFERVETNPLVLWGCIIVSKLDSLTYLAEELVEGACPSLCELFKATQTT
jgi:hypothetical protein